MGNQRGELEQGRELGLGRESWDSSERGGLSHKAGCKHHAEGAQTQLGGPESRGAPRQGEDGQGRRAAIERACVPCCRLPAGSFAQATVSQ